LPLAISYLDTRARPARAVLDPPRTEAHLFLEPALEPALEPTGRKRREFAVDACRAIRNTQVRQTLAARSDAVSRSPVAPSLHPIDAMD
jgi:hypothetical protein